MVKKLIKRLLKKCLLFYVEETNNIYRDDIRKDLNSIRKDLNNFKKEVEVKIFGGLGINLEKKRNPSIIASIKTIPSRFHYAPYAIDSILNQTVKPDKVLLWIDKENARFVPAYFNHMEKRGVEISFVDNIRSYGKYIHTLELYPEDIIITFDDDIWFNAMLILRGIKKRAISSHFNSIPAPLYKSQEFGLYTINLLQYKNEEQIKQVFDTYNLYTFID